MRAVDEGTLEAAWRGGGNVKKKSGGLGFVAWGVLAYGQFPAATRAARHA